MDSQSAYLSKENEDLKHDNTVLYQKSVTNKERLDQLSQEVEGLKHYLDSEKARTAAVESENRKLVTRVAQLEEMLRGERERVSGKERAIEEMRREREMLVREGEERVAEKQRECENVKRGFDEVQYEAENMRRTINAKQEEINGLNKMVGQNVY